MGSSLMCLDYGISEGASGRRQGDVRMRDLDDQEEVSGDLVMASEMSDAMGSKW